MEIHVFLNDLNEHDTEQTTCLTMTEQTRRVTEQCENAQGPGQRAVLEDGHRAVLSALPAAALHPTSSADVPRTSTCWPEAAFQHPCLGCN